MGSAVSHLEDVPLRLNALLLTVAHIIHFHTCSECLQNVFATNPELTGQIVYHYTLQGLAELYKVCY